MANILLGYWYRLYTKQTKQEQAVEREICKLGIRYRTQHPFLAQKAFTDFYFPDYNLVVEIDDPSHNEPKKIKKDRERTERLQSLGLTIIRFTNRQVDTDLPNVIKTISTSAGVTFRQPTSTPQTLGLSNSISRETKESSSDDQPSSRLPLPVQSPSQEPLQLPAQPTRVKKGSRKRSR
jgi:very-short-patch-repair endonuclease